MSFCATTRKSFKAKDFRWPIFDLKPYLTGPEVAHISLGFNKDIQMIRKTLTLVLLALLPLTASAKFKNMNLEVTGVWNLVHLTCELDAKQSFKNQIMHKLTRKDQIPFKDHLLVLSPDGELRIIANDGKILLETEFTLLKEDLIAVDTKIINNLSVAPRMTVKRLMLSEMVLKIEHPQMCSGHLSVKYSRINAYTQKKNAYIDGAL